MTADQSDRNDVLHDFDRTFFVEAGAGTGKTTIIVGRIVNLVAAGRATMDGLAAITFTEAAAAELRDRVREGLERAAAQRDDGQQREHCRRAVAEIDLAAIQTIHAFAGGLLRSYPIEAGLPPGFATLDPIEQGLAFEDRFRAWFWEAALAEPGRTVLRRALLLGLSRQNLYDLAAALDQQHDLLTRETTWPSPPTDPALAAARAIGQRLVALADLVEYAIDGPSDPLAQVISNAQPVARRLLDAIDEDSALAAVLETPSLPLNVGQHARWSRLTDGRNACLAIKDELRALRDDWPKIRDGHRQASFAEVLALLRDFVLDGVAGRKRDGVATFQDLLAWARDLLRDNPSVRRRARQRYGRIFVDEFQDTDPLQAEIVFYLAAEPDDPLPADWRQIVPAPGKLFVVGDPKQSIYRFRRADIAIYDDLLARLEQARGRLVQNFRSVRPVLDWVNHHFERVMLTEPMVQPPYVQLEASWESFADGTRCGVYRVGGNLGQANAGTVARAEAQALAGVVRQVVGSAMVTQVLPDGRRELRPAHHNDVAILLRSRTYLRTLERELERVHVPYRVEGGSLLLQTQEVRDLLACLRAIDDPSDQVALVAALRSPAYACPDPEILRWLEGGGQLNHEAPGDGPEGSVKSALTSLADFHARRLACSPPALVDAFLKERLLVAAAFDEPRPREAWRRLRYVVARARAFTAAGRHSLRAFLDWIETLQRAVARESEGAEVEADEQAVRILTIHGAKGLEFPIVLLARLGATDRGRNDPVQLIADRRRGSLACRAGSSFRTPDFDAASARELEMAAAESIRLQYVAATRARDHLVLSLFRSQRDGRSAAAMIEQHLHAYPGGCTELRIHDLPDVEDGAEPVGSVDEPPTDHSAAAEQLWLERRADLIGRLSAPPTLKSPTDDTAAAEPADDDSFAEDPIDGLAPVGPRSDVLLGPNGIAPSIADHPTYQRAISNPTHRAGVPLLATVDGLLIDLTIDVLYEEPNGMVLVLYHAGQRPFDTTAADYSKLLARAFTGTTGFAVCRVDVIAAEGSRGAGLF